jgi:hypothetical protein
MYFAGRHEKGKATSWNMTHSGAIRFARRASHAAKGRFIAL